MKGRILIADDDPLFLELTRAVLGSMGLDVTTAADGDSAVRIAERESFVAAILDQDMPGMTGLEATRRLRASFRSCRLPILICTADGARKTVQAAKAAGADAYLVKPFPAAALLGRMTQLLKPMGVLWA